LVLAPTAFVAHRSLHKRARNSGFEIRLDTAFSTVISRCAGTPRPRQGGTWIARSVQVAYTRLHQQGVAHSVEAWQGDTLVGGLYGLAMGRAFFGESMFAAAPDASKISLWRLCRALAEAGYHFVDCQQDTGHLRSLGGHLVTRAEYMEALGAALLCTDGWPEVVRAFEADPLAKQPPVDPATEPEPPAAQD
jgi:leucyl/phenylalanyl-tRNA--protein transferase